MNRTLRDHDLQTRISFVHVQFIKLMSFDENIKRTFEVIKNLKVKFQPQLDLSSSNP